MSRKDQDRPAEKDEPKEKTPKGYEVRTPTRGEFFRNLAKVAKTKK